MGRIRTSRRAILAAGLGGLAWAGGASAQTNAPRAQTNVRLRADRLPPIVFVHDNGDTAALWHTTMWRFESNGYPRRLLYAIDYAWPSARSDDGVAQPGRSSTADQRAELAAYVKRVLQETRRRKVVLIGSSRGGNSIRNFLKNGGGAELCSHAILGGATNHGVLVSTEVLKNSEFNGAAPFLRLLNEGPTETVPGVSFLTLRSDKLDKFAQPDGLFLGMAGKPTGLSYDAPELKGATNVVLPGLDHREVAFHKLAFQQMFRFIVGEEATSTFIAPEREVTLTGRVTGFAEGVYSNIAVAGATVEIWAVDASTGERRTTAPLLRTTTPADGVWGPFRTTPEAWLEFVVTTPGNPVTHIYRSPFLRSSDIVHLRPGRFGKDDEKAGSVVYLSRPRGYFGHGRDKVLVDGKPAPGIPEHLVPSVSTSRLVYEPGPARAVLTAFNNETIPVRTWPAKDNHLVIAEFHA